MAELFTVEHLTTFLVLTALETVLGFDNLLYISIEFETHRPAERGLGAAHGNLSGDRLAYRPALCRAPADQPVSGAYLHRGYSPGFTARYQATR